MTTNATDRAQRAALAHRMASEPAGRDAATGEPLARIWCARCGWLRGESFVAARYAAEPFGCPWCADAAKTASSNPPRRNL